MMMLMGQSLGRVSALLLVAAVSCAAGGALRPARDVAHLPLEYLPPVVLPPLPSREYLPPVERHAASLSQVLVPPRDYLPPSNEYLPPAETTPEPETTEAPIASTTTESPTTEAEQPATTTAQPEESEAPAATEAPATHEDIVEEEEQAEAEIVEPAGVLRSDGYHYAAPQIIPDLTPTSEAYLPPLVDNAVVAEPAAEGEDQSAAFLDDGYHYRAIRRLRL